MAAPLVLVLPFLLPANLVPVGSLISSLNDPHIENYISKLLNPPSKLASSNVQSVSALLENSGSTEFKLSLTELLKTHFSPKASDKTVLQTKSAKQLELLDPTEHFRQLCNEADGQEWLNASLPNDDKSYLIVAVQTVFDSEVSRKHTKGTELGADLTVPVGTALTGGADILGLLNPGIGALTSSNSAHEAKYTTPGEMIWAIKVRKIKISWFQKKIAKNAILESKDKARWAVPGQRSSSDEDEEEVEAELDDEELDLSENGLEQCTQEGEYIIPSSIRRADSAHS